MSTDWANKIVGWDVVSPEQLLANPANFRRHPAKQREALRGSLNELGMIAPVLVNRLTGHLLDGHARVEEYITAGVQEVPVAYVEVPPEKEGLALLSLDPIAAMAEADKEALDSLLREVSTSETGLREMIADLAKDAGLYLDQPKAEDPGAQIDNADELREKWGTEHGQIWQVGKHRVMCGDATSEADVGALLGAVRPLLMVTDPPYGVEYDPGWRNKAAAEGRLAYAASRIGEVTNDDRADWSDAWCLFPGDVVYSWHPAGATSLVHAKALQDSGFVIRMQIIWAKSNFPIGRGDYHVRHEPCWYAIRKGKPAHRTEDRTQTTLWEINLDHNVDGGHSTQKPLECMARPIRNHDFPEVYDPFLGSGTTAAAAESLDRTCYGMEIEPKYVAVTLERLTGIGLEAKLL